MLSHKITLKHLQVQMAPETTVRTETLSIALGSKKRIKHSLP